MQGLRRHKNFTRAVEKSPGLQSEVALAVSPACVASGASGRYLGCPLCGPRDIRLAHMWSTVFCATPCTGAHKEAQMSQRPPKLFACHRMAYLRRVMAEPGAGAGYQREQSRHRIAILSGIPTNPCALPWGDWYVSLGMQNHQVRLQYGVMPVECYRCGS